MVSTLQEDLVYECLREVVDPELGISVVDLGLIYDVKIDNNNVVVKMTLTSPGCPVGAVIQAQCHQAVKKLPWAKEVNVQLVWIPRWDPKTMASEEAKMDLGIL
ncbi:MAG TPA: metal-sulfur cluster assembly factor [Candidatus Obscuribacter sp.]|nr:metal-sulfur cluster assembly factor [Candidatus Obscuribacter sp.]MBK9276660.1 metal-sulfur cluster assembly factor [Candidatus Obscuribacter sp.]MBL8082727.1 metal-sulfur cluster assembly factor [Candidatus Obscuribacter sp.]HMW89482.1 metal-sulfur cluster assembly factor [Candidatus Obscuribacter sp.]HMX48028.1 metal-sulfur cluster assembly factor [Candidatus Obscuribacter sp.]